MTNRRTLLSLLAATPLATVGPPQTPAAAPPPTGDASLDIFQAVFKGDLARATELAKLNPSIAHLRSADGRTPLHYAAAAGNAEMIFFLTQRGADLSAGPESPLFAAIECADHAKAFDAATALLMNASNSNAQRADGKTALEVAAARGYSDIVKLLVHRGAGGANVDSGVERVYFGQRYRFDLEGRPYTREDLDGLPQDLINEYARLAHFDVERVKHLTKLAPSLVHGRATWDESAIEAASHMGIVPLARFLADRGAAVSTCTAALLGLRDRVAQMTAADPACVRERGAHDIALLAYTALGEQRADVAEVLLKGGAGIHEKALGGLTTLHLAASKGYMELADLLLTRGADVNEPGRMTPLAIALRAKQEKMADYLKSRGGRT